MNRALSPALKPITLPSGRQVSFRHFTMWEKRFIMHCFTDELRADGIMDQELLAAICLVNIDGVPVDFGAVLDYMENYISNKAQGSSRLNEVRKADVCNMVYNKIIEYFDDGDLDWQYYIGVWIGVCMPTKEIKERIDSDVKNVLAVVTATEASSRTRTNPQELVAVDSSGQAPTVNFV